MHHIHYSWQLHLIQHHLHLIIQTGIAAAHAAVHKVISVASNSCFVLMSQCTTLICNTSAKGVTTAPCTSNVTAFLQLWIECTNYIAVKSSTWFSSTAFDMSVSCFRYRRSSAVRAGSLQITCLPYFVEIDRNMTVTCAAVAAVATASAALQGWDSCAA